MDESDLKASLRIATVEWHRASRFPADSLPIGNGDIGANVWVEPDGDVMIYISKTDAWDENGRLVKVGRLRLRVGHGLSTAPGQLSWRLEPADAMVTIAGRCNAGKVELRLWVDANEPVLRIAGLCDDKVGVEAKVEVLRPQRRAPLPHEEQGFYDQTGHLDSVMIEPDALVEDCQAGVMWYHRNPTSIWAETFEHQHLGHLVDDGTAGTDPLLSRTFGGLLAGEGFKRLSAQSLSADSPLSSFRLDLTAFTGTGDLAEWRRQIEAIAERASQKSLESSLLLHRQWWRQFWARSWILVEGDEQARTITRAYALQRYLNACAGRGRFPIKFNGSIFNVDTTEADGQAVSADYRRWGGPYWFQNTRLIYWTMLGSGDHEMIKPLFEMYRDALGVALARTQSYYGHGGAFFPETIHFWGLYARKNYGWPHDRQREDLTHPGDIVGRYIRYYWSGAIELSVMMLEYLRQTGQSDYFRHTCWPVIDEVLSFYEHHYRRYREGRIRIEPAMSLETWQHAVNPTPELAGLRHLAQSLLELAVPAGLDERQSDRLGKLLSELPAVPLGDAGEGPRIEPAAVYGDRLNVENPELYAVFPYAVYGAGRPQLDVARRSFRARRNRLGFGWCQDAIHAACLGLADEAGRMVAKRFARLDHERTRFPAFFGPNFDWLPDQDHGNSTAVALQRMLLQWRGDEVIPMPAWPKRWSVRFKLPGPGGATYRGSFDAATGQREFEQLSADGNPSQSQRGRATGN
jgi:hypothetical protein